MATDELANRYWREAADTGIGRQKVREVIGHRTQKLLRKGTALPLESYGGVD